MLPLHQPAISLGRDSNSHALRRGFLRPLRLPVPPPKVISSERDLNPHVLADTRLSTLRVYQFHHLTLSAWRDSNPHAGTPATDLKSVVSTNSTTSRLQPYSDSNREPEIWSHVGYQLPHRAI